jgi:lipopolysaccharide/colanic/teichoic acid biosynthesis glycosyltransferase
VRRNRLIMQKSHPSLTGRGGRAKRAIDIVLALAGLILLSPILAALVCVIRRQSPGPAIYSQMRLGLGGRAFVIRKLRTMRIDAETAGAVWAVEDDPRCTPIGGILRRTGMDEIPQLWNVLKGEMSLVGPRPERAEFHDRFRTTLPDFDRRLTVRAGITGLAQVRGWRGDTSIEERLLSDIAYIENWTIWKDLWILLRTPLALRRPRIAARLSVDVRGL